MYHIVNTLKAVQQSVVAYGTYTMDSVGNITVKHEEGSSPMTMTYDAASRLTVVVQDSLRSTYTYDSNGNNTAINAGGVRTTLAYDYENRMRTTIEGANRTTYVYWADGLRRQQIVNGSAVTYVWDGSDYLQARGVSEVQTFESVSGQIVASDLGGVERLLVPDPLGSVVKLLDASGNELYDAAYWPYGAVRSSTGVNDTAWGYVGSHGYHFDGSRRLYVRARVLDPVTGRWYTVDPLWPEESAYGYVSNPVRFTDRYGTARDIPWNDPPDFEAARNKWCYELNRLNPDEYSDFRDRVNACVERAGHSCKPVNLRALNCLRNLACNPNAMAQSCEPCEPSDNACVKIKCKANPPQVTWCSENIKSGGCNPFSSGVPVSVLLGHEMLHCCGYDHGHGSNEETCNSVVSCCILQATGRILPGVKCGNR